MISEIYLLGSIVALPFRLNSLPKIIADKKITPLPGEEYSLSEWTGLLLWISRAKLHDNRKDQEDNGSEPTTDRK